MIEPHVAARIRQAIAVQTQPRHRTFLDALQQDESFVVARGLLGSIAAASKYVATASDELKVRARIVWGAVRRSYGSLVGRYADSTLQDLRDQLAEHMQAQATQVRDTTIDRMKNHQPDDGLIRDAIDNLGRELLREADVEAQFYVDELQHSAAQVTSSSPVITIHGNVGAVQTGTYAMAHVSTAGPDRDRLVVALEGLRQAIHQSTEVTSEQREHGTELIGDVIKSVTAEKPNVPKVAGLMGGLATTVQTVASLRGAWDFVRDAAVALGILGS